MDKKTYYSSMMSIFNGDKIHYMKEYFIFKDFIENTKNIGEFNLKYPKCKKATVNSYNNQSRKLKTIKININTGDSSVTRFVEYKMINEKIFANFNNEIKTIYICIFANKCKILFDYVPTSLINFSITNNKNDGKKMTNLPNSITSIKVRGYFFHCPYKTQNASCFEKRLIMNNKIKNMKLLILDLSVSQTKKKPQNFNKLLILDVSDENNAFIKSETVIMKLSSRIRYSSAHMENVKSKLLIIFKQIIYYYIIVIHPQI